MTPCNFRATPVRLRSIHGNPAEVAVESQSRRGRNCTRDSECGVFFTYCDAVVDGRIFGALGQFAAARSHPCQLTARVGADAAAEHDSVAD